MPKYDDFIKERDEALLSLDKNKILAYFKKYSPSVPPPSNDTVFWLAVHKARLMLTGISNEDRKLSEKWIDDRGFKRTPY